MPLRYWCHTRGVFEPDFSSAGGASCPRPPLDGPDCVIPISDLYLVGARISCPELSWPGKSSVVPSSDLYLIGVRISCLKPLLLGSSFLIPISDMPIISFPELSSLGPESLLPHDIKSNDRPSVSRKIKINTRRRNAAPKEILELQPFYKRYSNVLIRRMLIVNMCLYHGNKSLLIVTYGNLKQCI